MKDRHELAEAILLGWQCTDKGYGCIEDIPQAYKMADAFIAEREKQKEMPCLQIGCIVEVAKVEPGFVGSNGYVGKVGKLINYYEAVNEWVVDFGGCNNLHLSADCFKVINEPAPPEVEPETRDYLINWCYGCKQYNPIGLLVCQHENECKLLQPTGYQPAKEPSNA